jgi:conjugal transfer pilus assembly protein TraW
MKYYSKILGYAIVFIGLLAFGIYLLFSKNAEAKNLGIHGNIWEIQEVNIITYIKQHIAKQDVEALNKNFAKNAEKQILHPKPATNIIKTIHQTVHYFDPTITLTKDITDQNGKILHTKGTKINPLHHMVFKKTLIFIDGNDTKQVEYASKINGETKIILVKGSPIKLMQKHKNTRFYFDQEGYLTKTFGIATVPSIAKSDGNLIKIEGIVL